MSTERPIENQIIDSGDQTNTIRNDEKIISSASDTKLIISSSLMNEVVLNGTKYSIEKQIARSGEAEIFLVSSSGSHTIFKYYYSQYKPKDEILTKLKGLKHPDIIGLIDYGYYQDRFFEISEYAQGGTIQEIMPVTSIQKVKEIVAETIEALNYCHTNGIIHRDIKPENIFYRTSDKKDIAIGDFGIASNVKEGEELVRTSLARTSLYAAPELFTNIQGKTTIEKSVDYYALGMTLLHLWFGRNPFEDVDEFGIMRLKSEGRVFFPDNIDQDVEKLIKGLITVNPRDRWTYDEVKRWLKGEDVKVNYQTIKFENKPYSFGLIDGEQIVLNNPKDLAIYLEKYPEKGEGHLYRNTVAKWIEPVDPGLFNELMDIVEKDFPKDKTAGLTKAIYILDTERPFRGIDKTKLKTQEEIASHFEQNFEHYKKDLQNPNAAFFIFLEARNYKEKADEYRNYFKKHKSKLALNTLVLTLQGVDKFIIDNYTIYQPDELIKIDSGTKTKIIKHLSDIDSKLSLWIGGFKDLQSTIDKWRVLKRLDEITLRYALDQGFELNGSVANDKMEFHLLFKNNFSHFFSDADTTKNQHEINYWLTNYCGSSLTQTVIDYIKSESYTDKEFCQMLMYVLSESQEIGENIYQVIETLLPKIKEKASEHNQQFNNVIEIHKMNIESFWVKDSQSKSVRFLDCLKNYLSFVEKNISAYAEFFNQLTYQLNDRIAIDIRNDINKIKGNKIQIKSYHSDLKKIINRLKKVNSDLPYIKRFNNELTLIDKQHQSIVQKIKVEKIDKVNITQSKFNDIVAKNQKKYKSDTQVDFNKKIWWSIGIAAISLVLLIASIAYGASSTFRWVVYIIPFAGLGAFLGAKVDDEDAWGVIIGLVAGGVLGNYLGNMIPIVAIYIVSGGALAILAGRAYLLKKNRDDAINGVGLAGNELSALTQSLIQVDQFFAEKESYEVFQEIVRILSLDEKQFKKEISGANKNPVSK
jgi:hypothetical protein